MINEQESINEILRKSVKCIKGVGDERAKLLEKLGIYTIEDAITYFPRDYEDRSIIKTISQLEDGETCSFEAAVISKVSEIRNRKGPVIYMMQVADSTGKAIIVWYNLAYVKKLFKPGEKYLFYGKIEKKYNNIEIANPIYEKVTGSEMKNTCKIVPVYPSTAKLTQNILRSVIKNALEMVSGKLTDILPLKLRNYYKLCEYNYAINNIHFPSSMEDLQNVRYRLVFEELLMLQLGLMSIKSTIQEVHTGITFGACPEIDTFIEKLPFQLTEAQKKVFKEISADMESSKVMNRLVQGDVGSGKTIVAVLALFKAVKSGYQGALMVPTEILAEQHYASICPLVENFGIKVSLLTGSTPKKQKNELLEKIKNGEIDIVIGTHSLIQDSVVFKKLGLVITDEQHRFGVRQRSALLQKGIKQEQDNINLVPDMLVMTATPIPRTLALILYGDLDISIIDQLPPGRKPVKTYAVDNSMRERIYNFIRKNIEEGRQIFIVCPLVEESNAVEAKSAVETASRLAAVDFKDFNVGLIHGKMKASEKDSIMRDFAEGKYHILVATTVIEVGINIPNASVMVVENAERLGLAQLHQLRGRVGRGQHQSYCILFNESNSKISRERMKIMEKTNDGFVISEKDLELRGPGEFFGTVQHGLPELKIANLYKDMRILKKAQEAAENILKEDKFLQKDENYLIKEKIVDKFKDRITNAGFAL